MGKLILPSYGSVYIDTSVAIYSVEANLDYWDVLQPLWFKSQIGEIKIVSSELTLMEALVRPLKTGDSLLVADYEELLLNNEEVGLIPIDRSILREAARLRAETNLKTPDALHAATALMASCQMFLTNDYDYKRIPGLPAVILREVLES